MRQRVLTGKEAIVGTESEVGPAVHRLGEKQRTQPTRETGRHGGVEEQPHVTAVARPRPFERCGHAPPGAGRQIGGCVVCPGLAVEVDGQEVAGLVEQHRVDAHREGLARIVRTGQVPVDHVVGDRKELPVGTDGALDSRLLAHTGPPLVGARRGIARLAGAQALEAAWPDVLASSEEGAEQGDLGLGGGAFVYARGFVHGHCKWTVSRNEPYDGSTLHGARPASSYSLMAVPGNSRCRRSHTSECSANTVIHTDQKPCALAKSITRSTTSKPPGPASLVLRHGTAVHRSHDSIRLGRRHRVLVAEAARPLHPQKRDVGRIVRKRLFKSIKPFA